MKRALLALLAFGALAAPAQAARFEIGVTSQPGTASEVRSQAPFAYRYQYLAGGVNTGAGWSTWNENGTYVSRYVAESARARITPVFGSISMRRSREMLTLFFDAERRAFETASSRISRLIPRSRSR